MQIITRRLSSLFFLLRPLMFIFMGIVLLSLGTTSLVVWAYQTVAFPPIFFYLTLQFLPDPTRGLLVLTFGLAVFAGGIWKLSGIAFFRLYQGEPASSEVVLGYQRDRRPPRIAVLSGGAGMFILASLGAYVERLTCITPVQDPIEYYYRASSLFHAPNVYYVVPTPLSASVYARLDHGLVKNVMHIDCDPALAPHHVMQVFLVSEPAPAGPVAAPEPGQLSVPDGASHLPVTRLAREVLHEADAIVLGPGSLFESILPNLLIDDLRAEVQKSAARKIYICNLMTEPGLTTGFSVGDHIRQIQQYGGFTPDYVLVNAHRIDPEVRQLYAAAHQVPVHLDPEEYEEATMVTREGISTRGVVVEGSLVIEADLASSVIQYTALLDHPGEQRAVRVLRHDPQKLTAAILELLR
ncbi:MAG: hypothetical protein HC884_15355 [Chloroflexaceae bacterium]|nr:hypothetical protein [Chloroflexaceae bacterium]